MASDCKRHERPGARQPNRDGSKKTLAALALVAFAAPLRAQTPTVERLREKQSLTAEEWSALDVALRHGALDAESLEALSRRLEPRIGEDHTAAQRLAAAGDRLAEAVDELDSRLQAYRWYTAGTIAAGDLAGLMRPVVHHAKLLRDHGRLDEARAVLESGLGHLPEDNGGIYDVGRVYMLHSLAHTEFAFGEWHTTRALMEEAEVHLEELQASGMLTGIERTFLPFEHSADNARFLQQMGLPDLADPLLREAITGLERAIDNGDRAFGKLIQSYEIYVNLLMGTRRYASVLSEVDRLLDEQATTLAHRASAGPELRFSAAVASEHLFFIGERAAAEVRARYAGALGEAELSNLSRLEGHLRCARFETLAGKVESARKHLAEADAAAQLLGHVSALHTAFRAATEARLMLVSGAELDAGRARLERAWTQLLAEKLEQPVRSGGSGFMRLRLHRAILGDLVELLLTCGDEHAALEALVDSQRLSTLGRQLGARPVTVDDVRAALLESGEGVLVYFPVEEGSFVFALDDDELVAARIAGMPWILAKSESLAVAVRSGAAWRDTARALAAILLPEPIQRRLDAWDTVLVVGRDYLEELAFECLLMPDGEPLCLAKGIVHLPTLALGVHWSRQLEERLASGFELDLRLVTDVVHSAAARERFPDVAEFRLGDEALAAFAAPFPAGRVDVRTTADATREALAAKAASKLLQVVSHGVVEPIRERPRGFLLSSSGDGDDGAVFSADVDDLAAAPLIAMLSVCSSAAGPMRAGDGEAATLVGAFLRSGALGVLATTSDAHLRPTALLMVTAQEQIARGIAPAEAVRRARHAVRDAGYDDPRHFAHVHATGLLHRALFPQTANRTLPRVLGACGVVLVLGLLVWFARRRSD
ncbi:MAG: CHAT domain-containing protein [bacterium]|nr:CHAT domain-containing protein [bacterium]